MFTGIVKAKGLVSELRKQGGDARMTIDSDDLPWREYDVGDSIAVNGVCLTAVTLGENGFSTDVSVETLAVTTLGDLVPGSLVNLEPAMSLGDRLGGHLVSGHVDCIGTLLSRSDSARSVHMCIEIPADFSRYVARKGSICVDGVSLTVNEVSGNTFELNIIPHTADVTIMAGYAVGAAVNVEVDLLARYVERLIGGEGRDKDNISLEFLEAHGYV